MTDFLNNIDSQLAKKEDKEKKNKNYKKQIFFVFVLMFIISCLSGFASALIASNYLSGSNLTDLKSTGESILSNIFNPQKESPNIVNQNQCSCISQEEMVVNAVKKVSPAVVSIIISKDVPVFEQYYYNPFDDFERFFGPGIGFLVPGIRQKGTEKKEIGGGTGIIISSDGIVLTNKHVVSDEKAEYTIYTNDGKKFPAVVLAKDPVQDLAILKIKTNNSLEKFKTVVLGDSDKLEIGQTAIAIGNALGEFRNTVSVGVISGLGRTITASGGGSVEVLEDIIQTDAAINSGNSGGPLLNLKGEVIGINVAMAAGSENIGFSIPINKAKKSIEQVKKIGKIVYPFLGVNYTLIDDELKKQKNLPVNYGALIVKGNDNLAVTKNSPAEKAGLKENDIILEFNNEKITIDNSLSKIIAKYNPGDRVVLKILRDGKEMIVNVILGERTE